MQQNRTNEKIFLNTIKETITYNQLNICKISSGLCIYDKPFYDSFKEKLEKVKCSATLNITGAIKSTSRERLYKELGLFAIEGGTMN